MHIGDKVRLLLEKEEGIIRNIIDNRLVDVEIEDGFIIPVLKKELVLIASQEKEVFHEIISGDKTATISKNPISNAGIFLGFDQKSQNDIDLHMINNTELDLLFRVFTRDHEAINGISAGYLVTESTSLLTFLKFSSLNDWPTFNFEIMFFKKGIFKPVSSIQRTIKFKPKLFSREKQNAPVLNKSCYLYQLDMKSLVPDPEKLKNSFFTNESIESQVKDKTNVQQHVNIDLHIEAIVDHYENLSNEEILRVQLSLFEEKLNNAIIKGIDSITFIHGVGNGILRREIHKRLSEFKEISYFEDAQKGKFGYGATKITIR